MKTITLPPIATPALLADASLEADALTLKLSGTADLRAKDSLDRVLAEVHRHALLASTRRVDVDLRELEFMNSSCFKAFVTWIGKLQDLPAERRYRIRLHSDPALLWQRRSLHALACFATELIEVVES
jgi:hypothetical protein